MSFQAPKALEKDFERKLKKVAQNVTKIISAGSDATTIAYRLNVYADQLGPWADKVIAEVVSKSNRHNLKEWRALSKTISDKMSSFYTEGAVAHAMRDLSEVGAGLIKSLPIDAGKKAVEYAQTAASTGMRHEDLINQIQELGEITHARAQLIARTEVARQQSLLTQTRAVSIGSEGYIWRTAEDGRVRPSHAALNGKFIRWDDPPLVDGRYRAHAGQIFNCRCYPEPVVPDVKSQKAEPREAQTQREPVSVIPTAAPPIDLKAERKRIFDNVPRQYRKTVVDAFTDVPEDTFKAYQQYGADIKVERNPFGGFQCDMMRGTVKAAYSIPRSGFSSARGESGEFQALTDTKSAFRHEYGHALDGKLGAAEWKQRGWGDGLWIGQGISDLDDDFQNAIDKYSTEIMDRDGALRKALGVEIGGDRITGRLRKNPPLSDICDALSGGVVRGSFGHGKAYYSRPGTACKEIFANLSEVYALKESSPFWSELKSFFPDLCAAYEKIIMKAATGGY